MGRGRTGRRSRRSATTPNPSGGGDDEARGLGFYGYLVRDVMTRRVVVARPDESLADAARRMSRRQVSGLPVVGTDRRLVGVLSEKDIVRVLAAEAGLSLPGGVFDLLLAPATGKVSELAQRGRAALERVPVRRAMSRPALGVEPSTSVVDAAGRLLAHGFNRLPVTRDGRVVGIVTRGDLLERPARHD